MTEQVLTTIITSFGAPGAVLVVCLYALRALKAEVSSVQEQRIADAKASTAMLLALAQAQHEHADVLVRAVDANTDATRELRSTIEASLGERPINRRPMPPPAGRR